ncbi:MAG: Swt1 family HEPN domain-containing protein [Pseudanabaenaceae cyanobacterium]
MSISNHERVGRVLGSLRDGLYPFVEREMRRTYGDRWVEVAAASLPESYVRNQSLATVLREDVSALLRVMWEQWNDTFRKVLGRTERTLVSELIDVRNTWAHKSSFSTDDTYRVLDSTTRLLTAISAPEADAIEKQKQELLRIRYEEQAQQEKRKATVAATEGQPMGGLLPWRELATPHPDVASGRFQQAEFAADLWQVYLDQGSDEYRDPTEFYRRTYLTEGLKQLLINALRRLSGQGGDPVIELQTNFGGGKTHAMLALYHLCQASQVSDLPGMEPIFQAAGIPKPLPNVNVAVLVGNKLQPSGIVPYGSDAAKRPAIKTLWGELAWQLGGAEGYEWVRQADETSTNPGDTLTQLFNRYAPCLILIDEWVSYARQLHEQPDLAGGSFDTQFTFAQTLSESAKNAKDTLLVVSIPSSDIEIGGDRGKEALDRLKNAIGRVESPWRPASAEESFEIVRRRLFQPTPPNVLAQRDAVIKAFMDLYRNQSQEFPSECKEAGYEQRMKAAYPIHPELFDRLYTDWSTLDKFQRTRGVLRLMAKVIHSLWERNDQSLLILPSHVPIDDLQVQSELTRYLEDNWTPVIERDVDGPNSLPLSLDRIHSNLGRYSACRRVARTVYLGSAPTLRAANRGLEERRVKLGCVQPGEMVATFGDALRRLTDQATYLYLDGSRYWVSTQPNLNRTAQERTEQLLSEHHQIREEIIQRLRGDKNRGEFRRVHIAPVATADIPDDPTLGVRLVVLHPEYPHSKNAEDSPARAWVKEALSQRGNSFRYHKNTLLFLAPDGNELKSLDQHTAQYLAWKSILEEKDALNLDVSQINQATAKLNQAQEAVAGALLRAYPWLLVPEQSEAQGGVEWKEVRLQGSNSPILQASRKAVDEGDLIVRYAGCNLRRDALDKYLWRDRNHIDLKKLWEEYLTRYLYLPRLRDGEVLVRSVQEAVLSINWAESFAYAEGFDEGTGRYLGLQIAKGINPSISPQSLLVKPEVAQQQLDAENRERGIEDRKKGSDDREKDNPPTVSSSLTSVTSSLTSLPSPPIRRRFYGNVEIDAMRVSRDATEIANEVIQHLTALSGAKVRVTLEIAAEIPEGVPDNVVRTVSENCRTLKFQHQAFEEC